MNDQLL